MYRVTLELGDKESGAFLSTVSGKWMKVEMIAHDRILRRFHEEPRRLPSGHDPIYEPARTRAKRGSKVVDTILQELDGGMRSVHDLKKALTKAGLSENSLSTGVAILQKDGRISRDASGNYIAHQELAA